MNLYQLRNIENVPKRFESLTDLICHLFSCTNGEPNAENSPLSLKLRLFSKSSAVRLPKQKCVGVIISTKINFHIGLTHLLLKSTYSLIGFYYILTQVATYLFSLRSNSTPIQFQGIIGFHVFFQGTGSVGMHVANVKLSHCEAKFCRVWETKFGRVRRDALHIWACTPQKPNLPGLGVKIRLKMDN